MKPSTWTYQEWFDQMQKSGICIHDGDFTDDSSFATELYKNNPNISVEEFIDAISVHLELTRDVVRWVKW